MGVMRTLRRYNRQLLALFVVLLMIVFMLPQFLKEYFRPDPLNRKIGSVFGEEITYIDRQRTDLEMQVLNQFASYAALAAQQQQTRTDHFNVDAFVQFSDDRILDYLLLVREARHMGLQMADEEVDRILDEWQIPSQLRNLVMERFHLSKQNLRRIIGNYMLVREAYRLSATVTPSDPQLRALFVQTNQRVKTATVPLFASRLADQVGETAPEQLEQYYQQHTEAFRYPDRVAVEYLKVDVAKVKESVEVSRVAAHRYYEAHQAEFTVSTQPATDEAATQPTQPVTRQLSFEEAYPQIVERLKASDARERAIQAISAARDQAMSHWAAMPSDPNTGLKTHPEKVADYAQLAEQMGKRKHVSIQYGQSGLLSRQEAGNYPGLGEAYAIGQNGLVPFADYAFNVVPLVEPPSVEDRRTTEQVLVQDQESPILYAGSVENPDALYVFRVTQVAPSRLPESLQEVREQVQREWKLAQAYDRVQELAGQLVEKARQTKLTELFEAEGGPSEAILAATPVTEPVVATFARRMLSPWEGRLGPPMIEGIEMPTDAFADRAFEVLWPQPTTQPDGQFTTTTIADDDDRTVYVVQLLEKMPVTDQEFQQFKPFLARIALSAAQFEFYRNWFDPENLHKRTGYRPADVD